MRDPLLLLGDLALALGAVGAILFVVLYAVRSKWRRTLAGRSIMYVMIALILTTLVPLATLFYGVDSPVRPWVRLGSYSLVCVAIWWMLLTLLRLQRRGKVRNRG